MKLPPQRNSTAKKVSVIIRETELLVPFDYKTDKAETLLQILIHDSSRNRLIIDDIIFEVNTGKKVLVLTERKAHIASLNKYLKNKFEVIAVSGEDSQSQKKLKFRQINSGNFQILISTGQFLGEGTDIPSLDCLILAYPFSFEGKMIQYLGRVQRTEITPVIYDYRDIHVDYLEKLFRQRSRFYQKLFQTGQIKRLDELILIFNEDKIFINTDATILQIDQLDFPIQIEKFKTEVAWKIRVLNYDEDNGEIMAEIIDYTAKPEINTGNQMSLQFQPIDKIRFRSLDTARLLHAVELKRNNIHSKSSKESDNIQQPIVKKLNKPEWVLKKTMKVPFSNIQFSNACVAFTIFIEELGQDIIFEIENPDVRQEFEAVKEYFIKILNKKLIIAEIEIRYNENQVLSITASSEDINKINSDIIDSVRFEFIKKKILPYKGHKDDIQILNTLDTLLIANQTPLKEMFKSDKDLIDDILSVKNSKHYHHLKYLATQHLSSVLKIRFVLQPFSFLCSR